MHLCLQIQPSQQKLNEKFECTIEQNFKKYLSLNLRNQFHMHMMLKI